MEVHPTPTLIRMAALLLVLSSQLLPPCFADDEILSIPNVQFAQSLGGVVADQVDYPLADVQVIEVTSDWKTTIRSTTTDASGRWSLPPAPKQEVYFLRFITQQCCFKEVRCKVRLSKAKGKVLRIILPV